MLATLPLILKVLGTVLAALFVYALWMGKTVLMWAAWIGQFLPAEAIKILAGSGTLSGLVWTLRLSPVFLYSILGAIAFAVVVWLVWHFGIELDYFPHMKQTYKDDGIIAVIAILVSLIGRFLIKRNK
jgi:hypothetical protein